MATRTDLTAALGATVLLMTSAAPCEAQDAMTDPPPRIQHATAIMDRFAERTGLTSDRPPQRYLWTDAFAVANYLALHRATGDARYLERARALVEQVHHTLGRHRPDAPERGWLDGASEAHPTRGGLRIGKPLPERGADEPFDERLEWDRDGQYFHYLTKWMHALDLMARSTGDARYSVWARELAEAAHDAFVYERPGGTRMFWKMSVDLSRPLVPSMGQHDPLDGLVTYAQLAATADAMDAGGPDVADEARTFARMVASQGLVTADPLGLGGLLMDATRIAQLTAARIEGAAAEGAALAVEDPELLRALLTAAERGLAVFVRQAPFDAPATQRLGFRELGLAIGLAGVERMAEAHVSDPQLRRRLAALERFVPLRDAILAFWLADRHRRSPTWTGHQDINDVMLATALVPEGALTLPAPSDG